MKAPTKNKTGFYIAVTCPGCGAGLELENDFYSLTCHYCNSALRVVRSEATPVYYIPGRKQSFEIRASIDRYLKQNKLPLTRSDFVFKPIYYPYWKVDAIQVRAQRGPQLYHNQQSVSYDSFSSMGWGYNNFQFSGESTTYNQGNSAGDDNLPHVKLVPYTQTRTAGPVLPGLPISIGMRTQYVKVYPLSQNQDLGDYDLLPVQTNWDKTLEIITTGITRRAGINSAGGTKCRSELFNARGSIIYFPYFVAYSDTASEIDVFVLDGVSGRVVYSGEGQVDFLDYFQTKNTPQIGEALRVEMHRCRNCGIDLPAEKSSVQICGNCQSVILLDGSHRLEDGLILVAGSDAADNIFYPYWKLRLPPEIIDQAISHGIKQTISQHLFLPAFKMGNFEAYKRLATRITNVAPDYPIQEVDTQMRNYHPADLSLKDAIAMAEVIIHSRQITKNRHLEGTVQRLLPQSVGLIYVPFHPANYFMVDSINGDVSFEKSLA